MFRDLKEYQEIAKIYAEKVSKPEDLEERVRGGGMQSRIKPFEKPAPQVSGQRDNRPQMKGGIEIKKPTVQGAQGRTKRPEPEKPMPTTAEIRAKNPNVVPGTRVNEVGAKGGGKPSSGDLSMFKDKKPEISKFTKQGKERTPAQMAAAKRIGSGTAKNPDTTIAQVKQANQDAMRARAKERFAAFKAKRAEKKAAMVAKEELTPDKPVSEQKKIKVSSVPAPDMKYIMSHGMSDQTFADTAKKTFSNNPADKTIGKDGYSTANKFTAEYMRRTANTGKDFSGNPLYGKKKDKTNIKSSYEYDAYDLVLEYLLSTEQVATIEEANYVMTEMDAETIQGIVEEQKKTL